MFLAPKRQCLIMFYKPKGIVLSNQKGLWDKRLNFSSQKEMFYAAKRQCLTLWPKPAPLVPLPSEHSSCLVREWLTCIQWPMYSVHTPATLSERRSQRSLCDKTGMSQTFWDFKGLPGENTICGTDGSYNSYFLDTVSYHILYRYPKILIYGS